MKNLTVITCLALLILNTTSLSAQKDSSENQLIEKTDTILLVNGVCEMCKQIIERAAFIEGVNEALWDAETKILRLSYSSEVSLDSISASINRGGYDTEIKAASDDDYNALHKCCHYRDPAVVEDHQ
jgi:mercuric ion binding protein